MKNLSTRLLLLSCSLVLMAQMSTTLYLPALPLVASELNISRYGAELSISLFVFGAALPVIYWGHAAEKYGRKSALSLALLLFIGACLSLYVAQSLTQLLLARVIQGAAAGGAAIIARIVIRDYWSGDALAQKLSLLSMAFIAALGLGQFVGSLLTLYSDWRIGFLQLALIALLALLTTSRFPLKGPAQPQHAPGAFSTHYLTILQDKGFLVPCVQGGLGFATIVTLQQASPFVFAETLDLSSQWFGVFGLAIGLVYLLGSLHVKRHVTRIGSQPMLRRGAYCVAMGALLMLGLWLLSDTLPPHVLTGGYLALYLVIIWGQAVIFPNSMSLAASHSAHSGARSIALCGFLQQSMAGVAAMLAGGATQSHSWVFGVAMMSMVIVGLTWSKPKMHACQPYERE
ncbi:MFS transporter [Vibrio fluvialis]|uniref:MFS family transporter n=1 Tax=Vibrio fluvialis TaxID=676 RepID=A0AAX2LTK1_VIBFL|nr:MFS transporter [Vibrio fluvialis]AMF91921.1 MFS transporter [Vibrio fluvialis]EKO4011513.1 MFS transporter [Vibrio fluvialis]MBY8229595.1 MFS transporter [Vibrio fluvialis]MCE7633360.1 MFS transporter [Vibrio fluvialis]SUQ26711.1 MFS family transporter [Vibrio fluvialis]